MNAPLSATLRWLLVVVVIFATTFGAFILVNLAIWPDRSVIAGLWAMGAKVDPTLAIHTLHLLVLFSIALVWTLPSASAIAFAAHIRQSRALGVAFSVSVLLLDGFVFLVAEDSFQIAKGCIATTAAFLVIAGIGLSFSRLRFRRTIATANVIAILLLLIPSAIALMHKPKFPVEPKLIWSAVLEPEQWWQQQMNTGSEYGATRQVVLAGDRVVAVFDAGPAPYRDKQPMSNYRIVSLDARTGIKKDEINFVGAWGKMPYIYATENGQINVQSDLPRVLNADLSAANNIDKAAPQARITLAAAQESPSSFDPARWMLTDRRILHIEGARFRVLDRQGKTVRQGNLVEPGGYAGASRDGSRFAIESSYGEGDPVFLVYEHFTMYDSNTGTPLATVLIKDLPERQSWSAFSPDGKYFVVGKPNNLSMYLLP